MQEGNTRACKESVKVLCLMPGKFSDAGTTKRQFFKHVATRLFIGRACDWAALSLEQMSTAKRLVATLRGRKNSSPCGEPIGCNSSSSTRIFSSNPRCSTINNNNSTSNNELDEIAIVSNAEPCQVKYGSGPLNSAANGPRLVPGR